MLPRFLPRIFFVLTVLAGAFGSSAQGTDAASRRQFLVGCVGSMIALTGGGQTRSFERVAWANGADLQRLGLETVGRSLEAWAQERFGADPGERVRWAFQGAVWNEIEREAALAAPDATRLAITLAVAYGRVGEFAHFSLPLTVVLARSGRTSREAVRKVEAIQVQLDELWVEVVGN